MRVENSVDVRALAPNLGAIEVSVQPSYKDSESLSENKALIREDLRSYAWQS